MNKQTYKPSEFIASYEKSKISTPLSNSFFGREKEIENGLNLLDKSDILLVHGAAGTGKSKYSLELEKLYSDKNHFSFLCIGNKGISIWEDLKLNLKSNTKYILLIDDANRLAQNFQLILSLLLERESSTLKLIVTVRDYALLQVKSIAANFNYSTLEIITFSNNDIEKIIKSKDFNINEPTYVDRILKIAQGNARLAIMCAKVALTAKNILELQDASQIYDEYFQPLFKEVDLLKEPISQKSLAIISFYSRIDKNDRVLCDFIFSSLDFDENKFWEICYSLHESELVDLFEQQVVKISDQVFATYIFYKAVIENSTLSFNFFLDRYLDYENRITDTIVPVINTFNYKQIEAKLKPIILRKWLDVEKEGNNNNSLKYLDLFWFYLSPQVFAYLKKQIDNQVVETTGGFRYSYDLNEFSTGTGKYLEILARFKYHKDEFFKDALELMFYYAVKVPSIMPAVVYTLKEKFCFTRLGYLYGDRIQHLLFDFLINNAQTNPDRIIYENVLTEILPSYLKLEFNEHEGNGRSITIYTFHLWLSDSVKSFREKCFNYLLLYANKSTILHVLYGLNYFDYKHSNEILLNDLSFIYKIINKHFNPDEFEDCFTLQNILEGLDWLKVDYSKDIIKDYKNRLYQLGEVLKSDRQRKKEIDWQEEERLHKEELQEYCKGFDLHKYKSLFTNISSILGHVNKVSRGNLVWQYESSLNTIFSNLAETDATLFLEALKLNFEIFKFNLNFTYVFSCFFRASPQKYFELHELIHTQEVNVKFCYHQTISIEKVKEEHLSLLYSDLLNSFKSIKTPYNFWDLTFISKYQKIKAEKDIYSEILGVSLSKIKNEEVKISVGHQFIERCTKFDNFPTKLIIEAYLYSNKFEHYFDHDKKVFRTLIQRDSNVIIQLLKFNFPNKISYHDLEHENFDFIWELDEHIEIINSIFEYIISNETHYFSERAIAAFFPMVKDKYGDRPIEYLGTLINEKYLDDKYMDIVFSIICYRYPELKIEFLERFLRLNCDFDTFKSLEIIQRSKSWSGSYIPILESEKKIWESILTILDRLPNRINYYDHKEYVNRQIGYCELRIKDEMKREFYDDFR
ncbi:MAG: ATP-binding protein [Bacteroidales bacterium]|nr:ATP-binding protein [Bacteroidales bacterium]